MKPRITVLTLGVDDLERAVAFYRDGLALPTKGIVGTEFDHGAVAFFELSGGLRLALWPRASLAHDAGLPVPAPHAPDSSIGHNVATREEVDAVMAQAERAGARVVVAAHDTFWGGYAGYFQDPDDHLWEVVWNPAWSDELARADEREPADPADPADRATTTPFAGSESLLEVARRMIAGGGPPVPIAHTLGFTITAIDPGSARFEMDALPEKHANPMGTLHGGVLCTLADSAMGMAFASTLERGESFTTLELKINYLRPVWRAHIVADARVVKRGRDVGLAECDVLDQDGALLGHATSTCMVLRGDRAAGR